MTGFGMLAIVVLVILLIVGGSLVVWGSRRADNWITYLGLGVVLVVGFLLCMVAFPPAMAASIQATLGVKNGPIAEAVATEADSEDTGNEVVWQDDKDGGSLKVILGKGTKKLYVGRNEHGKDLRLFTKGGQWPLKANFNPLPAELWMFTYDARGNVKESKEIAKLPAK